MNINKEPYSTELLMELLPLAQKCWDAESEVKKMICAFDGERNFTIDPDTALYKRFEEMGVLLIVTLRKDQQLVGYAVGYVYRSPHHRKMLCACVDSFYIEPDYRTYGPAVEDRLEKEFTHMGADIIGWSVTPNGPVHELLVAKGFRADDVVMEKKLCVS